MIAIKCLKGQKSQRSKVSKIALWRCSRLGFGLEGFESWTANALQWVRTMTKVGLELLGQLKKTCFKEEITSSACFWFSTSNSLIRWSFKLLKSVLERLSNIVHISCVSVSVVEEASNVSSSRRPTFQGLPSHASSLPFLYCKTKCKALHWYNRIRNKKLAFFEYFCCFGDSFFIDCLQKPADLLLSLWLLCGVGF